jgi:hypothetical protein
LATSIFDRAQAENQFSLPPFYAQEWKQGTGGVDSDFVCGLPEKHRAAAWASRLLCAEASSKEFMEQIKGLPIALTDGYDLLVRRISTESADSPGIARYREATVTIHDAGKISEINWLHEKIIEQRPMTCKYFYDAEAVKEDGSETSHGGGVPSAARKQSQVGNGHSGLMVGWPGKRNLRNVWHLGPEPFPDAHFATFPTEIPRRCIKAGTSERGVCAKCGAPWCRSLGERHQVDGRGAGNGFAREHRLSVGGRGDETPWVPKERETIGWQSSCKCDAGDPVPAVILDCFAGSGTTLLVADQLQRHAIGIELNPDYARMAADRIHADAPLFSQLAAD